MESKPNFRLDGSLCLMEWVRQSNFMATSPNGVEWELLGRITGSFLSQSVACQQEISAGAGRRFYKRRGFVFSSHCSGKKLNDRFKYCLSMVESSQV